MESVNKSFISSTFWTERIGPVAALKTLQVMNETKSWKKVKNIGDKIKKRWREIFDSHNLDVSIRGISGLSNFVFNSKNHQAYKTLITQEMIKKNFLATNTIYPCIKHSDNILDKYFDNLERIMKIVSICENDGHDIRKFLKTDLSDKDFQRYN